MVNSEHSTDNYKSPKSITGAKMKHLEMSTFVTDHPKTKKMLTRQMCDKTVLENCETLESVLTATKVNKRVIKLLIITLMH